ncbi:MAG: hypothetical protein OEM01_12035 [Desulfobulbaceae bacterium]|nr:hypothetical protein [Desulfobulbaceae bacterium]
MKKKNCWEFKQCGRETGGARIGELGVCPAATEKRVDGINEGHNGGRACWAITGTFCSGVVEGRFASKVETCLQCDFYRIVRNEQDVFFQGTAIIIDRLKEK